jgi:hypothetical protein
MVGACPTCRGAPDAIIETVHARVAEDEDRPGVFDYTGDTDLDTQTPLLDKARPGEVLLACGRCQGRWWSPQVPA